MFVLKFYDRGQENDMILGIQEGFKFIYCLAANRDNNLDVHYNKNIS